MSQATLVAESIPYWDKFIEVDDQGRRIFRVSCQLEYVRLGDLLIDYHASVLNPNDPEESILGYQRKQDRTKKRIISNGIDPDLFGALTVNHRKDGRYAVTDGGTRTRILREIGFSEDTYVPCLVYRWTDDGEIQNYVDLNQERAGLTPVDLFLARIKVRNPRALAIEKILEEETGFTVSSRDWKCVSAINEAFDHGNLPGVMGLMNELNWTTMPSGRTQQIVGAIDRCLHAGADPKRALDRWENMNPALVKARAIQLKGLGDIGSGSRSIAKYYAVILGKQYDTGAPKLPANKRLNMSDRLFSNADGDE
jgi:hypothetical protein